MAGTFPQLGVGWKSDGLEWPGCRQQGNFSTSFSAGSRTVHRQCSRGHRGIEVRASHNVHVIFKTLCHIPSEVPWLRPVSKGGPCNVTVHRKERGRVEPFHAISLHRGREEESRRGGRMSPKHRRKRSSPLLPGPRDTPVTTAHFLGIHTCPTFSTTVSFQGRNSHLTDEKLRLTEWKNQDSIPGLSDMKPCVFLTTSLSRP